MWIKLLWVGFWEGVKALFGWGAEEIVKEEVDKLVTPPAPAPAPKKKKSKRKKR